MFTAEEAKEVQLFLGLLFPWDDENINLYKSVMWTFVTREGQSQVANYAAQSFDGLMRLIENRKDRLGSNVYVGLGTQRAAEVAKTSTDGFVKAIRQARNIVSHKAIWLDIDVGKPGAYATTEDAFAALDDFCRKIGLPEPTMEVYSGSGGIHVYWCFVDPMPQANWYTLARALQVAAIGYGLKFDPQCTVNPAQVLRVPNTYNHKSSPATKVMLYRPEGHLFPRYGYQQMVGVLNTYMDNNPSPQQKAAGMGGAAPIGNSRNFIDGVSEAVPVALDDLAAGCPLFFDMVDREGKGDAEPLWNLAVYAASFTTDPHESAHTLSRGDDRYSFAETEKKLHEKINARANNPAAGWPTCESFSVHSPICARCPLFAVKKTPFHHARRVQPNVQPGVAAFVATGQDPLMPTGYWRDANNHVWTILWDKKGTPHNIEVVNYPILDAGIDANDGTLLYQSSIAGVASWREINVSTNMTPVLAASALSKGNGLYVNPKHHAAVRDFLVAWMSHLQDIKRAKYQSFYGWSRDGSAFAFDDKIFHKDRTEDVGRGNHHDPNFTIHGEVKPWQDAMPLVYGNMPLEATVATAFGAPLVELLGASSLVVSLYSRLSGIGKSTAMMLAQSVWGHPRAGMSTLADTTNSMMKKIGDLRSLPVYWDELRTKGQLEKVIDIVFQVTQGKAKARLTRDIVQAEAPTFTTMFVVASNYGIGDSVYVQTESTEAGGLRVFEMEAEPIEQTSFTDYEARQLLIPLQNNYGIVGATYGEWLARNKVAVVAALKAVNDDFNTRHQFEPKERFWSMAIATILVGAMLANAVGLTRFDLVRLRDFLDEMIARQRATMRQQDYTTMAKADDVKALLQEMISDLRGRNLIITETIPYSRGKPTVNNLVDTDPGRLGDVWMQIGDQDQRVRARTRPFNDWLRERHFNPKDITSRLKQFYVVTQSKQTIGSGVPGFDALAKHGRAECYDFTPLTLPAPNPDSD